TRAAAAEAGGLVVVFDPTRVTPGIELSDDPILRFRAEAYRVSSERRAEALRHPPGWTPGPITSAGRTSAITVLTPCPSWWARWLRWLWAVLAAQKGLMRQRHPS